MWSFKGSKSDPRSVTDLLAAAREEKSEVPEVPEGFNDFDSQQLLKIIEELFVATQERKWHWHLMHRKEDDPYPAFGTSAAGWDITITNHFSYYDVTVEQDRHDRNVTLLSDTFHRPTHSNDRSEYQLAGSLWTAILQQPAQLKTQVDGIIGCLREEKTKEEDEDEQEQQDSTV